MRYVTCIVEQVNRFVGLLSNCDDLVEFARKVERSIVR